MSRVAWYQLMHGQVPLRGPVVGDHWKWQFAFKHSDNHSFSTIMLKLGAWCHNSRYQCVFKPKPAKLVTVLFCKGNNEGQKQDNATALPWNAALLQPPVVVVDLVAAPDVDVAFLLLVFLLAQLFSTVPPLAAAPLSHYIIIVWNRMWIAW